MSITYSNKTEKKIFTSHQTEKSIDLCMNRRPSYKQKILIVKFQIPAFNLTVLYIQNTTFVTKPHLLTNRFSNIKLV